MFWALQFKDAGLHIPYSQLLSSIEHQSVPMFELLLELVLVYRLQIKTVRHFWVSFSGHTAFHVDLHTAQYSERRGDTRCWVGVVFLLFFLRTLEQ